MGIGERLKQEREAKNLTLNDIQKQTKIQTRYLNAIEEENFNVMPGSFYVRAFIKEYATVLDLDADALMSEYEKDLPFDKEEKVVLSRVNSSKKNKAVTTTPAFFSFLPSLVVVLLVIGIVVVVWLFQQRPFDGNDNSADQPTEQTSEGPGDEVSMPPENAGEDQQTQDSEEETNSNGTVTDGNEETETEPETETTITLDEFTGNDLTYSLETNEETLTLSFETTGQNWLNVENANGERFVYETLTTENMPIEVDITEFTEVYVKFGNPHSINMKVNDKPIELPAELSNSSDPHEMWINIVK
ncbi:helix-turn-helix domain-containing protein [Gracilibacillus oryzae]|uniref:Helix-turn-helix domain-containing protein n=1 Tax=Gracilibacillus oryzae TaxID=1672701 RepID=A0A7C8GWA1_9BACI|nr:RodZ domain-containing protein [Gracilibacillus oryzae]KAB8138799.1 helix-turn-helix domain-containing protein [Gracilibacillus oryzae]